MPKKIWLGTIYIKDEGGYKIVLKSLSHYKKRLRTIESSPELKDSPAMFRSLLQQEAMKTIPKIDEIVKKICDGLIERKFLDSLSMDVSFLKKALLCYESDIKNAIDSIDEYFLKIIEDLSTSMEDLVEIKKALNKTAC